MSKSKPDADAMGPLYTLEEVNAQRAAWKRAEAMAARYMELTDEERSEVDRAVEEHAALARRVGVKVYDNDGKIKIPAYPDDPRVAFRLEGRGWFTWKQVRDTLASLHVDMSDAQYDTVAFSDGTSCTVGEFEERLGIGGSAEADDATVDLKGAALAAAIRGPDRTLKRYTLAEAREMLGIAKHGDGDE